MKLLIHICCADCGIKLIDALKREHELAESDITLYFYNPNIHPESEFRARMEAVKQVFSDKDYSIVIANWSPKDYFDAVRKKAGSGFSVWNKTDRCPVCWELRLSRTIGYAKDHGFEAISSTLFSSIYHDAERIISIGKRLEGAYGIPLIIPKAVDHCLPTAGFYKQNYEGCAFSLVQRIGEKYQVLY